MMQCEAPLHVLHVFSTFAVGGPQTRFVNLANAWGGSYRHTILAMDGNHAAVAGLQANVAYTLCNMPVKKGMGISLSNILQARRLLGEIQPDLLCTYNWGAIEWSLANLWSSYCPEIHVEDGFGPEESPHRQYRRRTWMRRLALARTAAIVVPSRVLQKIAVEIWKLRRDRVVYLPNGIDAKRFARPYDEPFLRKFGISSSLVIGTVAALRPEKNLCALVRFFSKLTQSMDAQLVIVGEGSERCAIEAEALRFGVSSKVVLTGALNEPERVLGRFDVFALTSVTEQMPNSVLEAMAAGLAVCATDVGDVKEMLSAENRPFVVAPGDEGAFVKAMASLLRDRALRASIGEKNRERLRREYDLSAMVSRYDHLFKGMVARKILPGTII